MRSLSYEAVLVLHEKLIRRHGGLAGLRDEGVLRAALSQPDAAFDGHDLYPSVADKAAAVAHAIIANHPFHDGNKRVGHALLEIVLRLNGLRLEAEFEDREAFILTTAAGQVAREAFRAWVRAHIV